jgi:hypothetical protein
MAAMRNFLAVSAGLLVLAATSACDSGPGAIQEPPVLRVTSPTRGLVQDHADRLTVSGTVVPGANGSPIAVVLVNNVEASLGADGAFSAPIELGEGATLIETVARDTAGVMAFDTRAVVAGQLRAVGTDIPRAITAAMSADTFAKLSAAAGPIVKGLNLGAMLAPLQPMVHWDDPNGEDCEFARVFIDDIKFSDVKLSLVPAQDGLAFTAEIDNLDVPGHARYALACLSGSNTLRITADKIAIAGTLNVTPNGMAGFTTTLANPDVSVTNFRLTASGIPGGIISALHLDSAIQAVIARAAELALSPLMNQALGALGGPQQLDVLGTQLAMQVAPSAISFDPSGALVAMNMKVLLAGGESSPGFLFTDNGTPSMDPGHGFQLGLADDLVNEMLAELQASGLLELTVPVPGGLFDGAQLHMTLPPMVSADASDGELRLVIGDLIATFTSNGAPVARAAINARVDLKVTPLVNGGGVSLQLGTPDIHINVLDDIANVTGFSDTELANASATVLGAQIDSISKLLVAIPLPAIAGLQVSDLSIGSDSGYVMVQGQFR